MKVILLAGGLGTRLSEETRMKPKPMVTIGNQPLLWHIMHIYGSHGFNEFIVACGYMQEVIKDYFSNIYNWNSDLHVDLSSGDIETGGGTLPNWKVSLIDTGLKTMTGGRVGRLREMVCDQTFLVTYGDGVGDINITEALAFHRAHGKAATVTAVRPRARFGALEIKDNKVQRFAEKSQMDEGWINGGFFIFEPSVLELLNSDEDVLEREPLETLARSGELMAYRHHGFWQPMDTMREREQLEELWSTGSAPWKIW